MKVSAKFSAMEASSVRKLSSHADEAKRQGKKVYHLNIGQPDIATPEEYFDRIRSFNAATTEYMPSLGIPELIGRIQAYYNSLEIHFDKDEIAVTCGGTEALLFAFLAIIDDGDEIVVPEPYYSNYNTFFTVSGANCVPVTTFAENGFHFTREDLAAKVSDRTRAILISNPGNPTGMVLTKDETEMIADLAREKDLFIISDEVYREFVFDGRPVSSFCHVEGIEDRLIVIDSVSKRYNACGARIGTLLTKNRDVFGIITKLCQGRLSCSTIEQYGAIGLYKSGAGYIENARASYERRRDIVYDILSGIDGVVCRKPEGAFYMIAKLPVADATDFLIWMLEKFDVDGETVMAAPADGFYRTIGTGRDEIRIAYVLAEAELAKALNILKEGLEAYLSR